MKKTLALTLAAVLALALLAGCGNNASGAVKTGLAVVTSLNKSADAGAEAGFAQADVVFVAVTVDAGGKITGCAIDTAQTKVDFGADGKIITALNTQFQTKNELGTGYGMSKASSIGKDWSEQAAALAAYVVGKTVTEVKGIAVDEATKPTGADLKASVTISIGGYIGAIEKAVANAKDLGAKTGDKINVGAVTSIARSKDAGAENGNIEIYTTISAATTDKAGKITSCVIDAVQANVSFDAAGKITSDLSAAPQTKDELGAAYGMAKASTIGKEWFEQAAAFAEYVKGKTASEMQGTTAIDEATHPTGADLKASVTMTVGDMMGAVAKAAK